MFPSFSGGEKMRTLSIRLQTHTVCNLLPTSATIMKVKRAHQRNEGQRMSHGRNPSWPQRSYFDLKLNLACTHYLRELMKEKWAAELNYRDVTRCCACLTELQRKRIYHSSFIKGNTFGNRLCLQTTEAENATFLQRNHALDGKMSRHRRKTYSIIIRNKKEICLKSNFFRSTILPQQVRYRCWLHKATG